MDKNLLLDILRKHSANSDHEAAQILALKKEFPFSQVLHAISAKLSKDFNFDSQQLELQQAAVYSTDRGVLKQIMTEEAEQSVLKIVKPVAETPVKTEPAVAVQQKEEITNISTPAQEVKAAPEVKVEKQPTSPERLVVYQQIEKTIEGVDVADTLISDLKRLNQLKHNFEMMFADQPIAEVSTLPVTPIKEVTQDEHVNISDHKESAKSKRAKIIELAKAMNNAPADSTHTPTKKRRHQDELLEELETSKAAIEPENERLKEQIELIDQFIKTQPTITNKERNPMPPTDLNSVKSGEFGENIVSETLVEILIKQGKKDRAIEVLKKLIWKYPQKKAYFASQIEDLKK